MLKKVFIVLTSSFLFVGLSFLVYIFYPRNYDVLPFEQLANTQFWNLSTGSTIGYHFFPGKGPQKPYPIIYLHGGPGGAIKDDVLHSLKAFAEEGYDIYAYDQIGSGSSERLSDIKQYTVARHTADLKEIIEAIGVEKVILLGQSWGSILATFFVIDHPGKVDKIIMTGPGPIFPINQSLSALQAPDSLDIKEPVFSNADGNKATYTFREKCMRWYGSVMGRKLVSDKEADDFFTLLNSALNKSTLYDTSLVRASSGGGGYYTHIRTMKSLYMIQSPREKIKALDTPVLILKGQYDNQKWGFTQEYLELFRNATLKIIPKAGHFIDVEQPEMYYGEIQAFLSEGG